MFLLSEDGSLWAACSGDFQEDQGSKREVFSRGPSRNSSDSVISCRKEGAILTHQWKKFLQHRARHFFQKGNNLAPFPPMSESHEILERQIAQAEQTRVKLHRTVQT